MRLARIDSVVYIADLLLFVRISHSNTGILDFRCCLWITSHLHGHGTAFSKFVVPPDPQADVFRHLGVA